MTGRKLKKNLFCSALMAGWMFCLSLLCWCPFSVKASSFMLMEHYSVEQGLPNNIVYCSLKGQDGFLWFGTWQGLCSFDGQKFKAYNVRSSSLSDVPPRKIQKMEEDSNGYLWIKTVDRKLYLFDKRTECFHAVYDEMKTLIDNVQIIKVQRTPDGRILLLTKDKNLLLASVDAHGKVRLELLHDSRENVNKYSYKLKENVFAESKDYICWIGTDYKLLAYPKGKALMSKPVDYISRKLDVGSQQFTCVHGTSKEIWMGDRKGNVYTVNPRTGDVHRLPFSELKEEITCLLLTADGTVYINTVAGNYAYSPAQGLHTLSALSQKGGITEAFSDRYDKIWFVQEQKGLDLYDPVQNTARHFPFPAGPQTGDFSYSDAGEQGLFFLTPSGEMLTYDRDRQTMTPLSQQSQFRTDALNHLFFHQWMDENDILWICSSSGVYRINFPHRQFKLLDMHSFSPHPTSANENTEGIRAIFQAQNGDVWVGTRWKELYRLDERENVKQVFSADNYEVGNVYHVMEDDRGNLWFSTKGDGLVKATPDVSHPLGYRFVRYQYDAKNPYSISDNNVYFTFQDKKKRIWVGLLGGGLNLLQETPSGTRFIHKRNGMKNYPPYGLYMEVRNMVEDESGRIWVGTMDGLMSFDSDFDRPEQIRFETYGKDKANGNLSDNDVYVLYKDRKKHLWLSVFGGGLSKIVRYDTPSHRPVFKTYGVREGLSNDVVMSMVEDRKNGLWFATENGLAYFNTQTELFKSYDKYDGFPSIKMEEASAMLASDGRLWFGSKQGVLIFHPGKLRTQNCKYKVFIVDFKISNEELNKVADSPTGGKSIKYVDEIELRHNQSMFTLEFAALSFVNQGRISYKYILEGYEREWHYNGRNRIASYVNVPPGEYRFHVQAVDEANTGEVSEKVLTIVILPPWWMTWWAKLVYLIVGIGLLYVGFRLSTLMVKMRNDVYVEQKLAELKIKFFTNVSHELRTPLTLIQGPIQELKEKEDLSDKGRQYVEMMEKSTNQMLALVNQILDFRKIQNGKMRLHVSHFGLNGFVEQFHREFKVLSEEDEISFTFQTSEEPIMVWADQEKISIVMRNILSNAFKFTPSGGMIYVSTGLSEDGRFCYIRIEDSGTGIPKEKQAEIFERFTQGENARDISYQGTGIGLALTKELVLLHHGRILVENIEPHGAAFTIELQLGKDHYHPHEVDFYMGGEKDSSDSEEDGKPDQEEETEIDSSLPTLLIVEDNRDLGNLLKLQLEERYNVYLAVNGVEGLKKVHLYHPDIVVTDQMMPEMDGLELLQSIRKNFQISHIPVIILTAKSNDESRTKAITLGANAYITKPFSKDYLIARIEQLLTERKLFRERFRQIEQRISTDSEAEKNTYEQFLVQKDVELLEKIHQVIERNLDNSDFNIDAITTLIGLSRSAFFKKVKSLTGLAPVDLVKEIRLNKSVELIKNTDLSISEIAFAVGFKDSGYFSKCFRKKYGQTPREYAAEWRKG